MTDAGIGWNSIQMVNFTGIIKAIVRKTERIFTDLGHGKLSQFLTRLLRVFRFRLMPSWRVGLENQSRYFTDHLYDVETKVEYKKHHGTTTNERLKHFTIELQFNCLGQKYTVVLINTLEWLPERATRMVRSLEMDEDGRRFFPPFFYYSISIVSFVRVSTWTSIKNNWN